ncbi:MAG TPA: hypothetical protein PLQ89_14270 [Phycisphaerae bacterium]|nr:hypothetical protein [Phycisphaerae bacterium]HOQ86874.1 hypothetical protein [Phycisphaerae bacterium]HPU28114.1 hypothetical protein [Phycisphaerae bacterium]HPZ99523.1 hypothetical protein [Phycisphaerae bacterium]
MQPILVLALLGLAAPPGTSATRVNKLLNAMERVESGGRSRAVSNAGRSRGPLQLDSRYWRQASKTGKPNSSYATGVWDRSQSREVTQQYWKRHAPQAYRRGDVETLARLQYRAKAGSKSRTGEDKYVKRVLKAMK